MCDGKGKSESLSYPSALTRKEKRDDWGQVRFSIGFSTWGIEIEMVVPLFVFLPDRKQLVSVTKMPFSTTSVFVCLFVFSGYFSKQAHVFLSCSSVAKHITFVLCLLL